MKLFKKKIKAEEIGIALFQMCVTKEQLEGMIDRLSNNIIDKTKLVEEEKLLFHLLALIIFAVDYSTFFVFGNTNLKNKILDEFYKIIKEEFEEEYDFLSIEVLAFSNAFKDKTKKDQLMNLCLYFSECISKLEQSSFDVAMISAIEFGARAESIKKFLNDINSDYKII